MTGTNGAGPTELPRSDLLDERIIRRNGPLIEVVRYWRGWHPWLGLLHWGLQGKETIEHKVTVRPRHTFTVAEPPPAVQG